MTTKVLSGYTEGVYLTAPYSTLSITATGSVGASGITTGSAGAYTVSNQGTVFAATTYNQYTRVSSGTYGLVLGDGGRVTNGAPGNTAALISGLAAIEISRAAGTVVNYGTLDDGDAKFRVLVPMVALELGGLVTNGSAADTAAEIVGGLWAVSIAGAGTVANFGTISGGYRSYRSYKKLGGGIDITSAGAVTNGSATDTGAEIDGLLYGVTMSGAGMVTNYGTISATRKSDSRYIDPAGVAIDGTVKNGTSTDTTAVISGESIGVVAGSVANYGIIEGGTTGVYLRDGIVTNFGVIGGGRAGVNVTGGTITNFGTIVGYYAGVRATGATVANYGTILSKYHKNDHAVVLGAAGSMVGMVLTNGSSGDSSALIEGQIKGQGAVPATIINFGTIENSGSSTLALVTLGTGNDLVIEEGGAVLAGPVNGGGGTNTFELGQGVGSLTNLSAPNFVNFSQFLVASGGTWTLTGTNTLAKSSVLEVDGSLNGLGNWTNNGTITGTVGLNAAGGGQTFRNAGVIDGLVLGAATDVLQLVRGQVNGVVSGGRGTLELVEPSGTLAGIGTHFTGFGTVEVDAGAVWTLTGGNTLAAGESVTIAGTLVNEGRLTGAGSIQLDGGRLVNVTGATIATSVTTGTAPTTVSNAGTMVGLTFGSAKDRLIFVAGAAFSGPVDGGGGTLELAGATTMAGLGAKFTDFHLVQIDAKASRTLSGASQIVTGETLAALGSLAVTGTLSNHGLVEIEAGLTLGGGTVAGVFDNQAGGTLELLGTLGITAGTASGTHLVNAGLLEKTTGTNTLTIAASLADTGTIAIGAGGLSFDGPVNSVAGKISGAGTLTMAGGRTSLAKGAAVTTKAWHIVGAATRVTLATSLSYAGALGIGGGATIGLNKGATWTLGAGSKAIITGATIEGGGLVVAKGTETMSGLVFAGAAEWENFGTWTQTGVVTLGGTSGLDNAVGAVFNITNDSAIKSTGTGTFIDNSGVFEKAGGSATSSIAVAITNVGTIAGEIGTLALTGAVTGTGKIEVGSAATVETGGAVAATQTVIFGGHNADLVILDAAGFKAKIEDFAQTDKLDFRQVAEDGSTKVSYVAGKLTVTDGTHSATVALLGQFTAAGFSTATDGHGGTVVTYAPPSASHAPTLAASAG